MNDPKQELLEDVFEPAAPMDTASVDSLIASIRKAKRERRSRKTGAALVAIAAGVLAWQLGIPAPTEKFPASQKPVADVAISTATNAPNIERIDDEGMAKLLDTTPSAVVEWPDGRRTLLLLVNNYCRPSVTR